MSEKDNNVMPLATDPHNLGEFDNVYDAMRRYPNGGVDGDYIYILGVQHFWNVNRQSWGILKDKEDNLVQMVEDFIGLFERRGYVFAGYALPDTTPVSGLDNIFYIAAKNGIYTHFGSDLKLLNEVAILRKPRRSSIWIKDSMDIPNSERIDVIDDAISRINVDIETIKSAIIGMENDLDGVHDSIDDINKDIDAFKKETSENFEEVNSDLDKVEKRLDYIPKESFLSARPAGFKPDIDLTPEITVDRAWRDHEGNVIRDTYITRRGLRNEIIDITNQQVTDLKPGSVDPDDLSEATKQLIGNKSITNLPDEEDITVTDNQTLKLKDKEYAPKDYSGMGRVYLRKHYVNGVNTLTQHMMRKPNTIYIIQYDYCLAGQTIEVPENCVLQFEGGSLRNGILVFKETHLVRAEQCFDNIDYRGTISLSTKLNMLILVKNDQREKDSFPAFKFIVSHYNRIQQPIKLDTGTYRFVNDGSTLYIKTSIDWNNSTIILDTNGKEDFLIYVQGGESETYDSNNKDEILEIVSDVINNNKLYTYRFADKYRNSLLYVSDNTTNEGCRYLDGSLSNVIKKEFVYIDDKGKIIGDIWNKSIKATTVMQIRKTNCIYFINGTFLVDDSYKYVQTKYYRYLGFEFNYCFNSKISNINIDTSLIKSDYTYYGFVRLRYNINISLENIFSSSARDDLGNVDGGGNSSYILIYEYIINLSIRDSIFGNSRMDDWIALDGNYIQNFRVDNVISSGIGVHYRLKDAFFSNCKIGLSGIGYTGSGVLTIENCEFYGVPLHPNTSYFAFFKGSITIDGCKVYSTNELTNHKMLFQCTLVSTVKPYGDNFLTNLPFICENLHIRNLLIDNTNTNSYNYTLIYIYTDTSNYVVPKFNYTLPNIYVDNVKLMDYLSHRLELYSGSFIVQKYANQLDKPKIVCRNTILSKMYNPREVFNTYIYKSDEDEKNLTFLDKSWKPDFIFDNCELGMAIYTDGTITCRDCVIHNWLFYTPSGANLKIKYSIYSSRIEPTVRTQLINFPIISSSIYGLSFYDCTFDKIKLNIENVSDELLRDSYKRIYDYNVFGNDEKRTINGFIIGRNQEYEKYSLTMVLNPILTDELKNELIRLGASEDFINYNNVNGSYPNNIAVKCNTGSYYYSNLAKIQQTELPPVANRLENGMFLYDELNKRMSVYNGENISIMNNDVSGKGDSSSRPLQATEGFQYYDTTLNKPIWWTGSNWIDATGATV